MTPRFSVIIPAHNEENRIGSTLVAYAQAFNDSEVIVVLNGCTDGTADRVRRVKSEYPNIEYVEIDQPVGKGGAVRAGFLIARSEIVGFADADGSTQAAEMRRLFESLGDRDAVVASRWVAGSKILRAQSLKRRIASRAFNSLVRLFFGLHLHDTQCGAKVFQARALKRVMCYVETSNMAFDVDLLYALKRAGFRVSEEPTEWTDVLGTRVQLLQSSKKMLSALIRLRLRNSVLHYVVPFFDRFFPTKPIRVHDGFSILILNWRDPKHPQAGGAETYLFEMAKRWAAAGNSVEWLTASFKGAQATEVLDGIRVTRVGNRFSVYALLPLKYLLRFRDRFDVVIDSENGIPFFSPLFSLKPKLCVMHHVHQRVFRSQLPFPISEIFAWLERCLMPRIYASTQFVAVSKDTRDEMQSYGMSVRPIEIVHNGVDSALHPGEKSVTPTVLYFGRLKAYKRVHLLIDAFARVLADVPNAILRIAGAGDAEAQLGALIRRRGIESSVVLEGYVSEERKRQLLSQAWVLVQPSSMEGWGISVIEANACGTPAIAYRVPGLREAIRDGVTGQLVDEGGDLAVPIARLLTDTSLRGRYSSAALSHAAAYSWDLSSDRFLAIMLQAIAGDSYSLVRNNGRWNVVRGRTVTVHRGDVSLANAPLKISDDITPSVAGRRVE